VGSDAALRAASLLLDSLVPAVSIFTSKEMVMHEGTAFMENLGPVTQSLPKKLEWGYHKRWMLAEKNRVKK
jgi:hypothetical protein